MKLRNTFPDLPFPIPLMREPSTASLSLFRDALPPLCNPLPHTPPPASSSLSLSLDPASPSPPPRRRTLPRATPPARDYLKKTEYSGGGGEAASHTVRRSVRRARSPWASAPTSSADSSPSPTAPSPSAPPPPPPPPTSPSPAHALLRPSPSPLDSAVTSGGDKRKGCGGAAGSEGGEKKSGMARKYRPDGRLIRPLNATLILASVPMAASAVGAVYAGGGGERQHETRDAPRP